MSISFVCATCGKKLKTQEDLAGRKVRCPECGAVLQVPEAVLDAEEALPTVPPADESYRLAPAEPAPAQPEDRKPCPMCGEMIKRDAVKCRYCGEIFDETLERAEKRRRRSSAAAQLSAGEWVVAILCSAIGCIVGIVWMIQGNPKGTKMFGVSLLFVIIWNIVRFALVSVAER